MGKSELHERKKARNYAVLAALLAFAAIVFCVTIVRMKGG